jgi:hypothetical protein
MGLRGRGHEPRHRAGVDDRPAVALAHHSDLVLEAEHHPARVDVDLGVEVIGRGIGDAHVDLAPGVVEGAVERAVGLDRRVIRAATCSLVTSVRTRAPSPPAASISRISSAPSSSRRPGRDHPRVRLGERDRGGAPDAARRADHHRHLARVRDPHTRRPYREAAAALRRSQRASPDDSAESFQRSGTSRQLGPNPSWRTPHGSLETRHSRFASP